MVNYIKEMANGLIEALNSTEQKSSKGLFVSEYFRLIADELDELNVKDFPPDKRHDYVAIRERFRKMKSERSYSNAKFPSFIALSKDLIQILDTYGDYNTRLLNRNFSFIHDMDLRNIIERDYKELTYILFPDGAWKSCVIMAGSILEAILYDVLTDTMNISKAKKSLKAPKGKDLDKGEWTLENLINVAVDIALLPEQRAKSIDQVLRDYRNFVHPKKEIKSAHPCTEAEALMAKGSLEGVCNHLETIV